MFTATDPEADPQDFIDEMHKNLLVMRATETEGVELAAYRLKGVAHSWFEMWEDSRDEGSPSVRWSEFTDAVMGHFLPAETTAAHAAEFENLKQGCGQGHSTTIQSCSYYIFNTPPARVGRGETRGGVQSLGGPSRFYDMSGRQSAEASLDIVTSILTFQSYDVYALIDPGSTLCYVTPYSAMEFGIEPEQLHEQFSISTPVGESITTARVYRNCVVTIRGRDTMADLIKLGMVDFDVIIGMDCLYSCFVKLDCRNRTMRLEFPNQPAVEGRGIMWCQKIGLFLTLSHEVDYKGCIYHLVRVTNTDAEAPTLESVSVVNESPDVFPDELPGIPPDREIDFVIVVMPGTQSISIPPYRIAPTKLKEQLKDLLEKGFIRPSVSPWGAPFVFV
ncbi:uncharacterized protein [Nicotiana sylvestris]|uniref:uncharacterized protein n=1 Tax=Nicotiana sylvestris TaxID=4096 RepID=UPI00388CBBD2